jgi:hypothetical protein
MIATLFGKKRITEERFANIFVNAVLELTAEGFPVLVSELNEAPEFDRSPGLHTDEDRPFALLVLAANLLEAPCYLNGGAEKRLRSLALSKVAAAFGTSDVAGLEKEVDALMSLMKRVNHPSKNTVYAMSKVVFHQYELFSYQSEYFRELKAPNPIVLKRLNGLMGYFLWNWKEFQESYRISG